MQDDILQLNCPAYIVDIQLITARKHNDLERINLHQDAKYDLWGLIYDLDTKKKRPAKFYLRFIILFDEKVFESEDDLQLFVENSMCHAPLTRYVNLRDAHAPECRESFPPPPTSAETAN